MRYISWGWLGHYGNGEFWLSKWIGSFQREGCTWSAHYSEKEIKSMPVHVVITVPRRDMSASQGRINDF